MTSPEHQRPEPQQSRDQPDPGYSAPDRPTSERTPTRAPGPASPTAPVGAPGFSLDQDPQTYDDFYRHVYGESAPPDQQGGAPAEPWSQAPGQEQHQGYRGGPPVPNQGQAHAQPGQWSQHGYPPYQGYQQQGYPDPRYASPGAQMPPYDPRLPTGQAPYYPTSTPDRDFGLAIGLTAVGFLGVAGLQYFYIGKIGKGVAYLLTAGWFGIGTVISLFTIGDEVIRTNDERRRGLR